MAVVPSLVCLPYHSGVSLPYSNTLHISYWLISGCLLHLLSLFLHFDWFLLAFLSLPTPLTRLLC
uniref:Uncharacterized protein n=2 Tax=Picea TaxID=3328 RepID=A0A101M005_PICGL|nr:hypothetical protein ABT39_MTgene4541 [Picea glauca]QHR92729.1 hypothetical protein Q903MT_gene6777 [Picea sitchensis]